MTSGRAANDCASRSAGSGALTDRSVTRTKNKRRTQGDDYKKIGFSQTSSLVN
jgi:hypothetical protein